MQNLVLKLTVIVLAVYSAMAYAEDDTAQQTITKAHEQIVQQGPASNFSGQAQFVRYPTMPSGGDVSPALVEFKANTISNWHTHPHGQYLIVTEGEGRTQEWGKPVQTIQKGDVIWCPPNVKHWHGASEHRPMAHIAITPVATDGKSVTWLEKVDLPKTSNKQITTPVKTVILDKKQLSLIAIAGLNATGDLSRLKPALIQGLDNGLTVNEIMEALVHQYAYAGFPRSLNGLLTLKSVLEQRQQQGLQDIVGNEPKDLPKSTDYYQLGTNTLSYLTQAPADQPLQDNFSPTVDYALKAHLFGYLFSRDNLGYLERELVTIATLSSLGNVNNQLRSHLKIAQNLGVTPTEMQKIIVTLNQNISPATAKNTQTVLNELGSV